MCAEENRPDMEYEKVLAPIVKQHNQGREHKINHEFILDRWCPKHPEGMLQPFSRAARTPCSEKVIDFLASAIGLVLAMIGFPGVVKGALLDIIGFFINGLSGGINEIVKLFEGGQNPINLVETSLQVFILLLNTIGLGAISDVIWESMQWWEVCLSIAGIGVTLLGIVASGGLAYVAYGLSLLVANVAFVPSLIGMLEAC